MLGRSKRLIAQNNCTDGVIKAVKKCWWLKINTKPVRSHSFDGAVFPNIIKFKYSVNGAEYNGKKFVGINTRGLKVGEKITVYYDKERPRKYAVSDSIYGRELY